MSAVSSEPTEVDEARPFILVAPYSGALFSRILIICVAVHAAGNRTPSPANPRVNAGRRRTLALSNA